MPGNSFGKLLKITTFGESHGKALGVVIDGCPPNISLKDADIQKELNKRKPGSGKASTTRKEADQAHILSGVFNHKTTGTPITILINNQDQNSKSYESIKNIFRPGHADFTYHQKYGIRDYRGGGRSSGRETVARVAAGAIAKKILWQNKTKVMAYTKSIGGIEIKNIVYAERKRNELCCPDKSAVKRMLAKIEVVKKLGNTLGGVVEVVVKNTPIGLGEPVFDKLDADLAKALMSIGAVKGIEIGSGFESAEMLGSVHNDEFTVNKKGITTKTNYSGGILGGISTGNEILLRASIKPIPSIAMEQTTIDTKGNPAIIKIKGRHDICAIPRVNIVCESMVALVLADHLLRQQAMGIKND